MSIPGKPEKIFLGHTPQAQRIFMIELLKHLQPSRKRLIIPAVGEYTLVKCALSAGFKPDQIFTSDISLFSSLLGFYFMSWPVDSLPFHLSAAHQEQYDTLTNEEDKIAYLLWIMKCCQVEPFAYRVKEWLELTTNGPKYRDLLKAQLIKAKADFAGVDYKIADLRNVIEDPSLVADDLLLLNPPAFTNGYSKMFNFGEHLKWDSGVAEFNFQKEYMNLYEYTKGLPLPVAWYRFKEVKKFDPKEVIFAKEYDIKRQDYWLITKPELVKDFKHRGAIATFSRKLLKPYAAPIFGDNDQMTNESKIRFVSVATEVGLYYRDLFAHRLGSTAAEQYYLMLVDGKVHSTVGFMFNQMMRMTCSHAFENFGFSAPSNRYPRMNRLLMLAITSKDMVKFVHDTASKKNRLYTFDALKTTCLSRYRTVKLNNGILKLLSREKMKNGLYKLSYMTPMQDRSWQECVQLFLKQEHEYLAKHGRNKNAVKAEVQAEEEATVIANVEG